MLRKGQPSYTDVFKHSGSNQNHRCIFSKDTVTIYTPNSSRVSVIRAKPFTIDRVPNIGHLQGQTEQEINQLASSQNILFIWKTIIGSVTYRIFSYRKQQVSFSVVLYLRDGPLMALKQDGFLWRHICITIWTVSPN